jgi:hypothetical protein
VYNFEVHVEHVYHVSELGVLVHNTTPPPPPRPGSTAPAGTMASLINNVAQMSEQGFTLTEIALAWEQGVQAIQQQATGPVVSTPLPNVVGPYWVYLGRPAGPMTPAIAINNITGEVLLGGKVAETSAGNILVNFKPPRR